MADGWTVANTIVQGVLAVVGLWYGVETRQARKHSAAQLKLLESQAAEGRMPLLVPRVHATKWLNSGRLVEISSGLEVPKPDEDSFPKGPPKVLHAVSASNETDNIAVQVRCFIYDAENHVFLSAARNRDFITGKSTRWFYFGDNTAIRSQVLDIFAKRYPKHKDFFAKPLEQGDDCYVLLTYLDVQGHPYWLKQMLDKDEDGLVRHKATSTSLAFD